MITGRHRSSTELGTSSLVCGAGIAGLATAGLLARSGWEVDLVEHSPAPRGGGYMTDFCGPGYAAAEAIGLLPRLQEKAYEIPEVGYVDRSGRCTAPLDYRRMRQALGGRLLSLLRGDQEDAIRDAFLHAPTITERFEVTVDAVVVHDAGVAGLCPTATVVTSNCSSAPMVSTSGYGSWCSVPSAITCATSASTQPPTSSADPGVHTACAAGSSSPTPPTTRWALRAAGRARRRLRRAPAARIPRSPSTAGRRSAAATPT